jgi:alkane 1-monooxygenase
MGKSHASWDNQMLRFSVYQMLWLIALYNFFGVNGLLGGIAVALIGVLLLETVNYLEHYGLRRRRLASGHFEPVGPEHSWNSNHEVGRILLYELTRHSDHHYKSTRKYQILRHIDESPQLPFGYPTAVLLSLVPPLWFAIMHKRLPNS